MTLADFLRRYLEDRRKVCEEKARSLDLSRDVHYFTKDGENENSPESSNPKYFSNTLEKPSKNDNCTSCQTKSNKKSIVSRVITRPDGKIQVETIMKDGNGNEEKRVTYHEGDKKYTIITRTDPSGKKKVEQQVSDADQTSDFDNPMIISPDQFFGSQRNSENNYDYWYNKFFKSPNPPSQDFRKNDMMPFDFNNVEESINNLLKVFENDAFAGAHRNQWPPNESAKDAEWFTDDFSPPNDPIFNEETRKFLEQFEKNTRKSNKSKKIYGNRKNEHDLNTQVDSIMKNFITPKSPSLFEQFAERAVVEIPEEETPLDKFIQPDEETQKKRLSIFKETSEFMKKLDNFFNQDVSNDDKNAVYSDISPSQDQDLAIFVPRPEPPPNYNDFGSIIAKHFGTNNANLRVSSTSKMRFPNGNMRTETVSRDRNGNIEKSVTYQIGNKSYNLVTVTTPTGEQIKKQKNLNFSQDELPSFRTQWDKQFQSDFND